MGWHDQALYCTRLTFMSVSFDTSLPRYDRTTQLVHWLSAGLITGLWLVGQTIDWFPKGDARIMVRSLHITLGVVLGLLLVFRVLWRRRGVSLPPASAGLAGRVAIGAHHLLYLLTLALVVTGLAAVWIRGDNLFNLFTVPAFDPGNKALRHDAVEVHELFANLMLFTAAGHALAALWHQWILKDGLIGRMWPLRK